MFSSSSASTSSATEPLRVLHPRSEAALRCIRNTADALRSVAPPRMSLANSTMQSNLSAVLASEPISRDDIARGTRLYLAADDIAQENLRKMGEELSGYVESLDASLEQHFSDFFAHLKRSHEQELALWVRSSTAMNQQDQAVAAAALAQNSKATKSLLPPSPALPSAEATTTVILTKSSPSHHHHHHQQQQQSQNRPSEHALRTANQQAGEIQRDMAFMSLQSWLLIELESLVSILNVQKAAVYFFNPINPDFLRLAAVIPRNIVASSDDPQAAPKEISCASHSLLTTVSTTGVGASIVRDTVQHPGTPRGEISFGKCICMPLYAGRATDSSATVGCIIIADKLNGTDFDMADELRVWGFCSSASGVFQRYSTEFFVPPAISTGGDTSRSRAAPPSAAGTTVLNKRSMVCNVDQLHSRIWLGLDSAASLPGLRHHVPKSKRSPAASADETGSINMNNNRNTAYEYTKSPAAAAAIVSGRRKHQATITTGRQAIASSSSSFSGVGTGGGSGGVAAGGAIALPVFGEQQKTPSGLNKMPMIRVGTVADAARAKIRITASSPIVASSTFTKMDKPVDDHDVLNGHSHEEVIESVAPYLRNLEGLWRKALDEGARMKNLTAQMRSQVEEKEAKIIELEVALRFLRQNVSAMQTDVNNLRAAVPDTLSIIGK